MQRRMYSRIPYVLILTYIHYGAGDFMTKNTDNYGLYYVEWERFDQCRGPKMKNMSTYTTGLIKLDNDMYRGQLNLTFMEETRIEEFRISVYTLKDKTKTLLWNHIFNKPCQHFMLAAVINTLNVQNCVIKKDKYYMDLNMTGLMKTFLGDSFFFGDYLFKVNLNSKKGNIVCLIFDPKFKKKIKK